MDDIDIWPNINKKDLWLYDKAILGKMLGHSCGLKGTKVPKPGYYIIKPISNLYGMARGAFIKKLHKHTDNIPDGFMWMELFEGRHLSIDYENKKQILAVEGHKPKNTLSKWDLWEKVEDKVEYPNILNELTGSYKYVNIEIIGGKIIEIHLRRNSDFLNRDYNFMIPVWEGASIEAPEGWKFIKDKDDKRLGFIVEDNNG